MLVQRNIETLEVDAIVNSANKLLKAGRIDNRKAMLHIYLGGGVCGAIFRAVPDALRLRAECAQISPCAVGNAKLTSSCGLPNTKGTPLP